MVNYIQPNKVILLSDCKWWNLVYDTVTCFWATRILQPATPFLGSVCGVSGIAFRMAPS